MHGSGPSEDGNKASISLDVGMVWSEEASRKPSLEHPTFGPLNGRGCIAFQRLYATDHVQQIRKVKAHPDYPRADLS